MEAKVMGSLYHYCTIDTLKAILENKTLRLSDISKSNDSKEINFLFDEYLNGYWKKAKIQIHLEYILHLLITSKVSKWII